MNELFNRIIAWHEKNLPADLPYEPLPQIGFLIEELGEINREFIKGDIDAAVGEITDLIVYSVNALVLIDNKNKDLDFYFDPIFFRNKSNLNLIHKLHSQIFDIESSATFNDGLPYPNAYRSLIYICCNVIYAIGYSPELALLETIKKIESRRGAWNPESGKWEKEKNQPDVYNPDYSLAKLKTTV